MSNEKKHLNKNVGGPIDGSNAKKWIKKFKDKNPNGVHAYFYGSDIIRKLLDQPGAVGMRIYFAMGDDDKLQTVLVASRADGSNMWPTEGMNAMATTNGDGGGLAADTGYPCPPICPPEGAE